ncbi:MAG: sugar phosphate nucleotidyltransferase [Candidatus Nanohaloarchaea archaeon]
MKGLIPAAGKGVRMRPFTKAYPKELLPVGEKAVIEHCIEAMKEAGIYEIVVVVGWKQHAILDYLGSGESLGVQLSYVVQEDRKGIAKALEAAKHLLGDENFAVILGDNYLEDKSALDELVSFHRENGLEATVGSFEPEDVTSHGIVEPGEDSRIEGMVEKPPEKEAPSKIAAAGIYVFEPAIFDAIEEIGRGAEDEYQLTDAIDRLAKENGRAAYRQIEGSRLDIGTPERLRKANQEFEQGD